VAFRVPRPTVRLTGPIRRDTDTVLGIEGGASKRGSTFWKQLRRCPREHALVQLGLRPQRASEALDVGKLFHLGLEVYYRTIAEHQKVVSRVADPDDFFFGAGPAAEAAAMASIEVFREEEGYEETYPEVERLLVAYLDHYRRRDRWRVLAVEETLTYDEGPHGLAYTARLDLVVEDEADRMTKLVEHKTCRYITADLLLNYQMDLQVLGQRFLWEHCVDDSDFYPFGGVLIDIVSKKKKPGPECERLLVSPSKYHVEAFLEAQRAWNAVEGVFEELGWPKALGNCVGAPRYFKTCGYYDLCHGRPEFSVADWEREIAAAGAPFGFILRGEAPADEEDEA
jgi:hypothetical protein